MTINVRKSDNVSILDVDGPLKMGEPEQAFRESVRELLESGTKDIVINLSGVSFMDSSGIGALVRSFSSVKRGGGRCKVFGARKQVMQLLKMVCLDRVLDLAEDEASALSGLQAG